MISDGRGREARGLVQAFLKVHAPANGAFHGSDGAGRFSEGWIRFLGSPFSVKWGTLWSFSFVAEAPPRLTERFILETDGVVSTNGQKLLAPAVEEELNHKTKRVDGEKSTSEGVKNP